MRSLPPLMNQRITGILAVFLSLTATLLAQESKYGEKTFAGLELRPLGPALTSGRIIDLAVDPRDARVWYIATAGGGVWKTTNSGTSFTPIFDDQKSFSIGCVTIDTERWLLFSPDPTQTTSESC